MDREKGLGRARERKELTDGSAKLDLRGKKEKEEVKV